MEEKLIGLYYTAHTLTENKKTIRRRDYLQIEVAAIIVGIEDAEQNIFSDDIDVLKKIAKIEQERLIYWSTLELDFFKKIIKRIGINAEAKYALTRLELFDIIQKARAKKKEIDLLYGMFEIGRFNENKTDNISKEEFLSFCKRENKKWWNKVRSSKK